MVVSSDSWRYSVVVDGREIDVGDGEVTLGRSRTATVRIEHESVSRSHALLTFDHGTITFKDLNSSNGSFLAGKRVQGEVTVGDGERIQLGAAVVTLKVTPPSRPAEKTALIEAGGGADAVLASAPRTSVPPALPPEPISVPHDFFAASAAAPPPPAPENHPLAIPADDLFRDIEERARKEELVVVETEADRPLLFGAGHRSASAEPLAREPREPLSPVPQPLPIPPSPQPRGAPPWSEQPQAASRSRMAAPPPPPLQPPPRAQHDLSQVPIRGRERKSQEDVVQDPEVVLETAAIAPRAAALLVDGVILAAIDFLFMTPPILAFFFIGQGTADTGASRWILSVVGVLSTLLIFAANFWYVVGGWARNGRTPGKSLLGLMIVTSPSTPGRGLGYKIALLRAFWYVVGSIPFGAGFFMAALRNDRKAFHDLMAGTRVVRTR